MARGIVDFDALKGPEIQKLKSVKGKDTPFVLTKIGHVVLKVSDVDRSVDFYSRVLGMTVSDAYPESMMPGKMVFMRFSNDHHGVALIGGASEGQKMQEMHHMAFEVDTIDEVFRARDHLTREGVKIFFQGRRRAGAQVAVEFQDPDGHCLEIYWGLDQLTKDENARPPEEWREVFSLEDAVDQAPPGQDTALADPSLRKE